MHTRKLQVEQQEGGGATIDLGGLFTALILTGVLALFGGAGSLIALGINYARADDQIKVIKERQTIDERNIVTLDHEVREVGAGVKWNAAMLRALLDKAKITERIERPDPAPSKLETPK